MLKQVITLSDIIQLFNTTTSSQFHGMCRNPGAECAVTILYTIATPSALEVGGTRYFYSLLVHLNDQYRLTFKQIATLLEANPHWTQITGDVLVTIRKELRNGNYLNILNMPAPVTV